MRKELFYFLFLLLIIGFVSCQSEDITDDGIETAELDDKTIIQQLGFDVSTLIDKGDYYLVEGDISLVKKNLKQHLAEFRGETDESKLKQGYLNGRLVSLTNVKNMTIRIDGVSVPTSGIGSDWRTAVMTAINAWNNIPGSCIKFNYTTASTADITVRRAYSSNGEYARVSDFPLNQKPSREIIVNSMHDNFANKANTIIHEMGHTVGFLHTHYTPAQQGGVLIPGTPTIDDNSIMSYNRNRGLIPGFSTNDIKAIHYLYPLNNVITSSSYQVSPNQNISYTFSGLTLSSDIRITWQAVQNVTLVSGQGTTNATFKATANGKAKVRAIINYYGNEFIFESSNVTIEVPLPEGYVAVHIGYVKVGSTFSIPSGSNTIQGYAATFQHLGANNFRIDYLPGSRQDEVIGEIATWDPMQRKQIVFRIFCYCD